MDFSCKICGDAFSNKQPNSLYCSDECRAEKYKGRIKGPYCKEVDCHVCGVTFTAKIASAKYCSDECRAGAYRKEEGEQSRIPLGRYVYVWFDGDVPFYVGMGSGRRAWAPHLGDYGRSMPCERLRRLAADFRVEIVRQNLTEEGARLAEAVTIESYSALGLLLTGNQIDGMTRQEKPPLELV